MEIFYIILIFIWAIPLVYAYVRMDQAIKYLHDNHKDEWVKAGKPTGIFYHPPGGSSDKFFSMVISTIFDVPKWAFLDSFMLDRMRLLHRIALFWNLGMLIIGILLIVEART